MNVLNTLSAMGALVMAATPFIGLASAAYAEPGVQPAYIRVADLDLSRPSDAAVFKARVETAAGRFCSRTTTAADLATMSDCRAAIRQEAVEKLGADQRQALQTASLAAAWRVAGR